MLLSDICERSAPARFLPQVFSEAGTVRGDGAAQWQSLIAIAGSVILG
jgi:hypothetical protein